MSELSHLLECSLLFKGMDREVGPYVIGWMYVIYGAMTICVEW